MQPTPHLFKEQNTSVENNNRIARNTIFLYVRMVLILVVSLYTSRIVLNILGIEDYGIYNVVAGFITMIGFLSSSMSSATQRFFSFELGRKDFLKLSKVFNMSVNIHLLLAIFIFIIAETIGLWFVNTQLTIPTERMEAAKWVYHFSIITFCANIIIVPFTAIIIAHEKMNVFAWISIIEVSLKLLIAFSLKWFGFDKLALYSIFILGASLSVGLIYLIYCNLNFKEIIFKILWDQSLFKSLTNFSGWNLFGDLSYSLYGQGLNILLNIFFGPTVNAARGISYQVIGAVNSFVRNFQMAINPQIIKSFSTNDKVFMQQLIYRGAKYSFFLLFLITLPILLETETFLIIWLKIIPDHATTFTKLVIIIILIESMSGPLTTAAQATGKIKLYNLVVGGIMLLILPVSYFFLKIGLKPEVVFYIGIFFSIISLFSRLFIIQHLNQINIKDFLFKVILKVIVVSIFSLIIPFTIIFTLHSSNIRFLTVIIVSLINSIGVIFLIGLNKNERIFFLNYFMKVIKK